MPTDTKISALPAALLAASTDEIASNQSGTTRKVTLAQISASIGSLGSGKIVQVVNFQTGAMATGTTPMFFDDTIPQITEGNEFMTLAITPVSATNKLKIDVVASYTFSVQQWSVIALFKDSGVNAIAAMNPYQGVGTASFPAFGFTHFMTAGGTVATTFRVRIGGVGGGTTTFNGQNGARFLGGVLASSITITEIIP